MSQLSSSLGCPRHLASTIDEDPHSVQPVVGSVHHVLLDDLGLNSRIVVLHSLLSLLAIEAHQLWPLLLLRHWVFLLDNILGYL